MAKIYESLRDAGIVTMDVNLLRGSYEDQSIYSNAVTVNGTPRWTRGPQGWGCTFGTSTGFEIASPHSARNPKTLAFIWGAPKVENARVFSSRTDMELLVTSNQLSVYNSTVRRVATAVPKAGVIVPSNGFGAYDSELYTFTPISAGDAAEKMVIGSSSILPALVRCPSPIYRAMLLNQALSQTAAQALLAELLVERYPTKSYYFQNETITKQIGTPALHWDLKERDASGQFPDLSGNGRVSTTAKVTSTAKNGAKFAGNVSSSVTKSGAFSYLSGPNHCVSFNAIFESTAACVLITHQLTSKYYLYWTGAQLSWFAEPGYRNYTFQVRVGRKYNITGISGASSLFVNGKQLAIAIGSGSIIGPASGDLTIGFNVPTSALEFKGRMSDFRWYSEAQDIRRLYLEGSRVASCTKIDLLPVSLANLTTVNMQLEDTPWRLASGQWSVVTGKAINCVAAGVLYEKCEEIGGTITTSIVWSSGTMAIGWTTVKGNATATGQNAYWARIDSNTIRITKSVAGVETVLATGGSIVAGKRYDVYFTWEFDGTLTLWIKEFGTSNWIKTATATDTAVTTNTFCCLYSTAASNQWRGDLARNEIALLPEEWSA